VKVSAARRSTLVVAAAIATLAPTACSSGSSSTPAASAGPSAVASSTPARQLRAADYVLPASAAPPGFTTSPATSSDTAGDAAQDAALNACIGADLFGEAANQAQSDDFSNGATNTYVSSQAQLTPPADVVRHARTLADPTLTARIPGCFQRVLKDDPERFTGGRPATVGAVIRISIPGVPYALRVKISTGTTGYVDIGLFARGRVESSLTVSSVLSPPDPALEAQLAEKINALLADQ
jgi:hypothetical protein